MKIKLTISTFLILFSPGELWANSPPEPAPAAGIFSLAPVTHIYPPYLADQKRVTFAMQILSVSQTDIPDTGNKRFGLRLGGRPELFNYQWSAEPGGTVKRLQANLEVGFRGHFDITRSLDNIGWDGNYGLIFSYQGSDFAACRFGVYHTSAHVGDEFAERTGRQRIEYTREELLAGLMLNVAPRWQVYAEGGYAYNLKNKPLQQHKRVQTGIQYQQHGFTFSPRAGWFVGFDVAAYEERDWHTSRSYIIGYSWQAQPHVWRLALEYYDGETPLGEFFQHAEQYSGISLQLDI